MSRIFITGDVHNDIDISKFKRKNFEAATGINFDSITKDDYMIVCGDFGLIWHSEENKHKENFLLKYYRDKPWITLFIDGNHENFDRLNEYPVEIWNGGKIHRISDSIIHLMRGQVFNIDSKTFFTMGGATSVDKPYRIPHISWWPQELPNYNEYNEALDSLEKTNYNVDYVLTHCCSSSIQDKLLENIRVTTDDLNKFFENLEVDVTFKHWYFGHYHLDKQIDNKHTTLYNKIILI